LKSEIEKIKGQTQQKIFVIEEIEISKASGYYKHIDFDKIIWGNQ